MPELDYTENLTGRELHNRMRELQEIQENYHDWETWAPDPEDPDDTRPDEPESLSADEEAELKELEKAENYYSIHDQLIHESNWKHYAEELANDTTDADLGSWPYRCIDWQKAARELASDYSMIEVNGESFYVL